MEKINQGDLEKAQSAKDYDAFYASVIENENPSLKSLPLAVQQKHIIVTCNYEARRRGLHKLQLIKEAKKRCPDVVIVLGEDLTRFRNASKDLYNFLRDFSWSGKVERLGFDEVFMDTTTMIDYNMELLNYRNLSHSFFHLKQDDPTVGFSYDATVMCGNEYPTSSACLSSSALPTPASPGSDRRMLRFRLASHLGQYLRHQLDEQKGYTSTVGISINKLLSKLIGEVHKPKAQTTLVPSYIPPSSDEESNVTQFIDSHEIRRIPGIGCKLGQKIRDHVLGRPEIFDAGLVTESTKKGLLVRDVRLFPGMGPHLLEDLLGGPGFPRGVGQKIWGLINGIDETEVGKARKVPRQISIEDSYTRLDNIKEVKTELQRLADSLLRRVYLDLTEVDDEDNSYCQEAEEGQPSADQVNFSRRWLAHPRTLRLTTRPRPPVNSDGIRTRTYNRISRSIPMPTLIFNLKETREVLVDKLVIETLVPLFQKLHPEKSGWNLSLVNIAVVNMVETATDDRGRDIGKMFKRQANALQNSKVQEKDVMPPGKGLGTIHDQIDESSSPIPANQTEICLRHGSEEEIPPTQTSLNAEYAWDSEGEDLNLGETCATCGSVMPYFAMAAHERFHLNPE
ncbi:MAG: hypothetical protein Q9187_000041 [Circinaria calcarea]